MTPSAERWAAVTRLFDELVELEPDARAGRLAAVGAADPDLRTEVERLLAADADADRRLAGVRVPFAAEPPARDPLGLAGSTLSHFRVIEPLGSGGMGVVYRAEDTRLERTVALKLPHAEHRLDTSWRERFLREGRSAAALDHPNLCQIYEVGETSDGRPFLAMPLYPGETLQARLEREGPLPVPVALAIAREIAAGLAALREAGIAHRDLKPGNVMLLPDGRVRILDFGLARAKDVTLTDAGVRQGTVAYMSPEQVRGDDVDGRADLWALGVVLYEMLTGRRPFDGDHYVSVAHAIVHEAPARPSALRRGLGAPVERLVLGLLDKDPASREPASRALLEGHPLPSRRPRWRGVAAVGGVLGALAVGWGLRNGAREPAAAADPNLIAVAPFDVPDPALELWREGMVDILSRDLDRAGPLRTVAQSVALARWAGRADPASAARLGERTGAGLVVFGSVLRRGADSVSLRAALLDRARGEQGPDLEVVGEERRVGELADSLAVLILRSLGADRPIGSVRRVSIGSRSLPALKAFLAGEQRYRRGDWDSALVQYGRAVAADSTFGLALRRMGYVIGWGPATSGDYLGAATYLERSVLFGRGLSRRESLLFTAESLSVALAAAADPDSLIRHAFAAVAALEEAARRSPDDPEVWYHLGEVLTHWSPPLGGRPAAALDAFERA
ncbi:MAG TPA: serine/threonine-protein kinase, partial [Gemmatimonadales bacterium]